MSVKRSKIVVGNWKMYGRLAENAERLQAIARGVAGLGTQVSVGVCVPYPYLAQTQDSLKNSTVQWGVQDVSSHAVGAYTGEVAASMAVEFGATLALTGHSERRAYHHERAEAVGQKTLRALEVGLTPIVCVGESLEEREAGRTEDVVGAQLDAVLELLDSEGASRIVLAYEPVWAIGTGRSATAEQAQRTHAALRAQLRAKAEVLAGVSILYGGSVKPSNAAELFSQPDIDGGLIGGASLVAEDFIQICDAASRV